MRHKEQDLIPMMDKVTRLFTILNAIQANPGISASDLADRCGVHVRTIYRDIDTLSLFAPIMNEGRGTGYRFIGRFRLYPLNFTEQEELAFSLLPSVVDPEKLPPGFDTAFDKVMATHRIEKSQQSAIVGDIANIIQMGTPAYRKESPNFLQPIIHAILDQRTIHTIYHTQYRNKTTARKIDPYYLIPREQRFYLIGYCHVNQEIRTFRISRFRKVEITEESFDKKDFNIKQYLKYTWSIEKGEKNVTFKVRFASDVARYIKEEELFVRPRMRDLPDGSMLFEVTVSNEKEFLRWIQQYGASAEILEPQSAREYLRDLALAWTKMYSG